MRRAVPWLVLAALVPSCAWSGLAHAEAASAVSLVSAGAAAIRFAVDVPALTLRQQVGADGRTSTVSLVTDGFECVAGPDDAGLPTRIVLLAVPPLGAVRVSATGGSPEVHEGVLLEGVPLDGSGGLARIPSGWRTSTERARLVDVSWMRNQRVARVQVRPADYDPATRRLTVYRHVEVTVQVESGAEDWGPAAESPDAFERVYRGALLNYEQGRSWRRPSTARLAARAALRPEGLASVAAVVPDSSVYFGRSWIKISVARTGFYEVPYALLRNYDLFSGDTEAVPLDSLRLFTWPGVPVLPEQSYCDSCDYREVAVSFKDDGDGSFRTNSDTFIFFGMGPSDWASLYDASKPETVFVNHPYATTNYYYLTRATEDLPVAGTPARIAARDGAIANPGLTPPATFPARAHFEQDIEYFPNASPLVPGNDRNLSWERWLWRSVKGGTAARIEADPPGADTTQAVRLRALTWGLDYNLTRGIGILDHYQDVSFNDIHFDRRGFNDRLAQVFDSTFVDLRTTGNQFTLAVPVTTDPYNTGHSDVSGLAWFDLFYARRFEPVGGCLDFDTPAGGNGEVVYRIGPFDSSMTAPPRVFDVTDPCRPAEYVDLEYRLQSGGHFLRFQAEEALRRRYRVVTTDSIVAMTKDVEDAPSMSREQNLRSRTMQADYIVIYYDGFAAAAESLAAWRRSVLPLAGVSGPYAAKTVPISALYDQFSGGRPDPAAIRNFLRAVYYNWNDGGATRQPSFVTLLGDASYDYKNLKGLAATGQPGCLVPTYDNNYDGDYSVMNQYVTDDWLYNVDEASDVELIPDFFGGRIPVDDAASALAVVRDKVLLHERSTDLGEWRNRVMFVADDDRQGSRADGQGWDHLGYTTVLDQQFTPLHMDRDYVYLHTYPTTAGYTKNGAKEAIKEGVQEGVALVNFVGHGSPYQLADEKVLLESDVGAMTNAPRFPIFVAASCDVGKFSDPTVASLGERLMISSGGAVGVISATERAFSLPNATMNRAIYDAIFRRDTLDEQYHVPVSEALLETKGGDSNGRKYQLMGDAGTCVALPRLWVELSLKDSSGAAVTLVHRGERLSFSGRVVAYPGGEAVPLSGAVSVLCEDSAPVDTASNGVATKPYLYYAGAIFRGDVGMTNGEFEGSFIVPLEAREGPRGRLRAYVQGLPAGGAVQTDGVGALRTTVQGGEAPTGDESGPRIGLSFVGGSTTVRPDAVLTVDLYDESGILTTNHAPQNGIVVTVDGSTVTRADITSTFRYAANSYQSGTASYTLPNLAEGAHTVTVSAADNLASGLSAGAHRSHVSIDFTVVTQPSLFIRHAYLFPNPTESRSGHGGGQFVVDVPGDSVNCLLRIYTVSGRLIRTLTSFGSLGQVQLPWDGLDEEGQPLANGVYFFRVHVNPRAADGTSSPAQKADANGRFVIVNR